MMGAEHSKSTPTYQLVQACQEGDAVKVETWIGANRSEFDSKVFVQELFEPARKAIEEYVYTEKGKNVWTRVPVFPAPDPSVISAIELALKKNRLFINRKTASRILVYSCCTHFSLVPIILRLFGDLLSPRHVMDGIYACETRSPETCWLVMESCLNQLVDDFISECFNICCERNNESMLRFLLDHYSYMIQKIVKTCEGRRLTIDEGIEVACSHADTEIVQLLLEECWQYMGRRLLWGCVIHKNLVAADLVFRECKRYLTGEFNSQLQLEERPIIDKAFNKAATGRDKGMLELFIDEIGTSLTRASKSSAFVSSCNAGCVPSVEMLLRRCHKDIEFKYGHTDDSLRPSDEVWALVIGAFGDRAQRTDSSWTIAPL